MFGWDVTVAGVAQHATRSRPARHRSTIRQRRFCVNGTGANRDSVGFPVRGWYYRTYTYADSNSDGFIVPIEVIVDPTFRYVGQLDARATSCSASATASICSTASCASTRLFDYKGGYSINNGTYSFQCGNNPACPGLVEP